MEQVTEWFDSSYTDVLKLIKSISTKVARDYDLEMLDHGDDLIQAGWVGALRAKNLYQPKGHKFLSYAHWFINGDVRTAARWLVKTAGQVALDALLELPSPTDLTFDVWIKDLLSTPDGLELLAAELSTPTRVLKDNSKRGAAIRKDQLDNLRKKWMLANAS